MVNPKPTPRASVRRSNRTPFIIAMVAILVGAAGALAWMNSRASAVLGDVDPGTPLPPAGGYTLGDSTAPVHVVEYADFECGACGQFATVTEPDIRTRLIQTGQVYYIYRDFPLPGHRNTWAASHAAHCAGEQGKFWEMHDRIYYGQLEWNGQATGNPKSVLRSYATAIGANMSAWDACYDEGKYRLNIAANKRAGEASGISSTPTFVFNNRRPVAGVLPYDVFKAHVDSAAAQRRP